MMKYGKDITKEIAAYLENGVNRTDAVVLSGISYETFTVWMKTHPEFSEAIKKAETKCKHRNISIIQKAARKTWQAAAWYLERKYHEEFALKQRHELTGRDGGPIVSAGLDLSKVDDDTLMKLANSKDAIE